MHAKQLGYICICLFYRWRFLGNVQFIGETLPNFWQKLYLKFFEFWVRMASWSIVSGNRQVSDTHRVRLGFQSGIWVGSCQLVLEH